MKTTTKLWAFIGVLILLSPLGVLLPRHCSAGSAWGEWSAGELRTLVGCVPRGLAKMSTLWHAPLAGYALPGRGGNDGLHAAIAYLASAAAGIAVIAAAAALLGAWLTRKNTVPGDKDHHR
jgi:hypothetical protein